MCDLDRQAREAQAGRLCIPADPAQQPDVVLEVIERNVRWNAVIDGGYESAFADQIRVSIHLLFNAFLGSIHPSIRACRFRRRV